MNAPDKIYIQPSTIDVLPRQNIIYTKRLSDTSIEYIRKDALLEWAKECYKATENNNQLSAVFKQGALYELHRVIAKIESL